MDEDEKAKAFADKMVSLTRSLMERQAAILDEGEDSLHWQQMQEEPDDAITVIGLSRLLDLEEALRPEHFDYTIKTGGKVYRACLVDHTKRGKTYIYSLRDAAGKELNGGFGHREGIAEAVFVQMLDAWGIAHG